MAVFTTQRTGNWSDPSATGPWYVTGAGLPAGGGGTAGVPGAGDTVSHVTGTLTVDTPQVIGRSPGVAAAGFATTAPTISQTAGGGSLPGVAYRVMYTNVDGSGNESQPSPETTFTLTAGYTMVVTVPALPTGIVSRNVYLGLYSQGSGYESLYSTGATGTAINCTSASWTNGTTTQAAAVLAVAMNVQSSLVIAAGQSLNVRGPVVNGNALVTLNAGAILEFNASLANTPASQKYPWTWSLGYSQGARAIVCNGTVNAGDGANFSTPTTLGTHVTIRSNAGGGNGHFARTVGSNDCVNINATYTDFVRIGDSVNDVITFEPSTGTAVQTFKFCTFDAGSGRVNFATGPAVAAGWDFEDCYFAQSAPISIGGYPCPLLFTTTNTAATGTRNVYRCRFDQVPVLVGNAVDHQDNFFKRQWQDSGSSSYKWANQNGALIRLDVPVTSYTNTHGDISNSFILGDPDPTPVLSDTVASATSTSLNGNIAYVASAYFIAGDNNAWFIEITSGAGVGQRRYITGNTTTTLSIGFAWTVTPSSGDSYVIIKDIANIHGFTPNGSITAGTAINYTGVVSQFTGTDGSGDLFSHAGSRPIFVTKNLLLTNGMGEASWTPCTTSTEAGPFVLEHNTWCVGGEAFSISEASNEAANAITSLRSNIAVAVPGRSYSTIGSCGGPYLVSNSALPSPSTNVDVISSGMADYNCTYGLKTTGQAATDFPGSPATQVGPYNFKASVAPGAHDQSGVNPMFVDPTRSFWTWAVHKGSASTTMTGQIADGLAYIRANPLLTRTDLIPWIQAGFTPTNAALATSAHDGTSIGAVQFTVSNPFFDNHFSFGFSDMTGGFA